MSWLVFVRSCFECGGSGIVQLLHEKPSEDQIDEIANSHWSTCMETLVIELDDSGQGEIKSVYE